MLGASGIDWGFGWAVVGHIYEMGSHIYENAIITAASRLRRRRCNWIDVMSRLNSYESVLLGLWIEPCSSLSWERLQLACTVGHIESGIAARRGGGTTLGS